MDKTLCRPSWTLQNTNQLFKESLEEEFLNKLWCITIIDLATSWFDIVEINNKTLINIANIVKMTWLNRYPGPRFITFDGGS